MTKEQRDVIDKYVKKPEWRVMAKRADFSALAERFAIDPVVARVIVNRDVVSESDIDMYLNGDVKSMHDPALMKDLPEGCEIIYEKLRGNKAVRIISDYDVDGVCSNYILLKGMRRAWAKLHGEDASHCDVVDYDIPHRVHDGYGINRRLIDVAKADGVDTLITCDNGIAAYEQTRYAKELGLTVIITDHHQVPYEEADGERSYILPPADAVIDIQRADCGYPFKGLCGAGVAYKFIQYLYRLCGIDEQETEEFMEILGLATNCDMMDLVGENRVYVKRALKTLRNSANPGLNALMRLSGRSDRKVSTFDLGFLIGPCINAAGRLGDAKTSLEFLLETDAVRASDRAAELLAVNNERKAMTDEGEVALREQLARDTIGMEQMTGEGEPGDRPATLADRVLVVYIPSVHESVVGIVASRLKEAYSRPVLVFTDSEEDGIAKGSGRSIESYNMFEELSRVKDLFTAFGGHAMAAGCSIRKKDLTELRTRLNENTVLTDADITPKLRIDVKMPLWYNSLELTRQIDRLEPYGKGNRRPLFAWAGVRVRRAQILGAKRNLLRLDLESEDGCRITAKNFSPEEFSDCIKQWFGESECVKMFNGQKNDVILNVAYYPQINEFNGRISLELMLEAYSKGK